MLSEMKDVLEALSYLATIIGIPVAIGVFWYEKRKERIAGELETYMRSNDKYIGYLTLCLQHPQLMGFDISPDEEDVKTSGLSVEQLTLFTILISTMETGFLLYRTQGSAIKESQYKGWHEYMSYWASRDAFRKAWRAVSSQFDSEFESAMNEIIGTAQQRLQRTALHAAAEPER
ncbi:MAG: hypothetical protein HOP15_03320 [Planctomycetes bacterium]|nr:hypothetical protein [Planctomycetota bacterium]